MPRTHAAPAHVRSPFRTLVHRDSILGALCCAAVITTPISLVAQGGDTSAVTFPNWKRADRVAPAIGVIITFDSVGRTWQYDYRVANGTAAAQDINRIGLAYNAPALSVAAPAEWDALRFDLTAARPGASFSSVSDGFVSVTGGSAAAPTTKQIAPGDSLAGFHIASLYPPGTARSFTRGYAPIPFLPDSVEDEFEVPDDTTDSQRGVTFGPTRYTQVVTQGTQETTDLARANRFLSFMNVDTVGTVFRTFAVIAIKFDNGSDGDLVLTQSFRALLNNVDVTAQFHPGPADGADLVAVFALGTGGPLVAGANVLKTVVDGLPSTFSVAAIPSVADTDVIKFTFMP